MLIAKENVLFMGDNILLVVLQLKEKGDYKTTCSPLPDAFGRRNYKNSKTHIFYIFVTGNTNIWLIRKRVEMAVNTDDSLKMCIGL